jgi:RNA recognition motif-containing protein
MIPALICLLIRKNRPCEMACLIQVGNLPVSVDSLVLQRMFEAHGVVRSAMIARHSGAGRSTGIGYIDMESEEGAAAAIAALNRREQGGNEIWVCWSENAANLAADRRRMFGPMNMTGEE